MYSFLHSRLASLKEATLDLAIRDTTIQLEKLMLDLDVPVDDRSQGVLRARANSILFFGTNLPPGQMSHIQKFYYWLALLLEFHPLLSRLKDLGDHSSPREFDTDTELYLESILGHVFGETKESNKALLRDIFEALKIRHLRHNPPCSFLGSGGESAFHLCMLIRDMEIFNGLVEAKAAIETCCKEEKGMILPHFILNDFKELIPLDPHNFQSREAFALITLSRVFNIFWYQSLYSIADCHLPQDILNYLKRQLGDSSDWEAIQATMLKHSNLSRINFLSN